MRSGFRMFTSFEIKALLCCIFRYVFKESAFARSTFARFWYIVFLFCLRSHQPGLLCILTQSQIASVVWESPQSRHRCLCWPKFACLGLEIHGESEYRHSSAQRCYWAGYRFVLDRNYTYIPTSTRALEPYVCARRNEDPFQHCSSPHCRTTTPGYCILPLMYRVIHARCPSPFGWSSQRVRRSHKVKVSARSCYNNFCN